MTDRDCTTLFAIISCLSLPSEMITLSTRLEGLCKFWSPTLILRPIIEKAYYDKVNLMTDKGELVSSQRVINRLIINQLVCI